MKQYNLAALLIAALALFSSCHYFTGKQAAVENPLLGSWKIDSIATGEDSSGFGYLLLAMAIDDSAAYDLTFEKDTVTFYGKGALPDKTPYVYIDSTHQVVLKDASQEIFVVRQLNDSTTGLQSADSSIIFLKKR
jgi:hypothetical protein